MKGSVLNLDLYRIIKEELKMYRFFKNPVKTGTLETYHVYTDAW